MRLLDYLERPARYTPEAACLLDATLSLSREQVIERARAAAAGLARLALPAGSTVAILSDNCADVCVLQLGINLANCAWTGLHPSLPPPTLAEVMQYLDVKFLFFQAQYAQQALAACEQVPELQGAVCIDGSGTAHPGLSDWCSAAAGTPIPVHASPDIAAWVQHTGGPGGPCHGTVHSFSALEIGLANVADALDVDATARHLVIAPLTHAAGIFAMSFMSVGAVNIIHAHFDAARIDAALRGEGVTHIFLPPTALYALLDHVGERRRYPALRCIVVAGAPVAPDRFRQAIDFFGPVLYEVYGQTESLLALVKKPADYLREGVIDEATARSAGRAVRFSNVALLDDEGVEVPTGARGEIAVRSSMLMQGYHKKPEWTARTRRNGWHLTGDIGVCDERGYVTIVDRKREMVVSGSFNVFTGEVEACLERHPAVAECVVFGIPDPRWGEAVHAVVVTKDPQLTDAHLIQWAKDELGSIKAPKSIRIAAASDLPRDAAGRIDKPRLKAPHWDGQWRRV